MRIVATIAVLLWALAGAGSAAAEVIRVGGTGSGLGTIRLLGDAFEKLHPRHRVEVLPALGSSGGLKALRAAQLELAISNREPSAEDRAVGLKGQRFASTALALVTHAEVPATAMTRQRLADLLSGREARWPNGKAVRLVLRPPSDSDTKLLASLSPEVDAALKQAQARPGMVIAQTDTEAADYIERTPHAFGASTVAQVNSEKRRLNILSLDGLPASTALVEAGQYPMVKDLLLVTRNDASEAVRAFASFVTESPEARSILRRTGLVSR